MFGHFGETKDDRLPGPPQMNFGQSRTTGAPLVGASSSGCDRASLKRDKYRKGPSTLLWMSRCNLGRCDDSSELRPTVRLC